MEREWSVEESIAVTADPDAAYRAISDVRRMGEWSPECRAVWARRGSAAAGARFVGFNRKGPFVWFTTCRVTSAEPGREFAFHVETFGLPVARWGYRFDPAEGGGTTITEYWQDLRQGPGSRVTDVLARVFSGTRTGERAGLNRAGMRTTLERLKRTLDG